MHVGSFSVNLVAKRGAMNLEMNELFAIIQ